MLTQINEEVALTLQKDMPFALYTEKKSENEFLYIMYIGAKKEALLENDDYITKRLYLTKENFDKLFSKLNNTHTLISIYSGNQTVAHLNFNESIDIDITKKEDKISKVFYNNFLSFDSGKNVRDTVGCIQSQLNIKNI